VRTGACNPCACGWDVQEQSIFWLSIAILTYLIFCWDFFLRLRYLHLPRCLHNGKKILHSLAWRLIVRVGLSSLLSSWQMLLHETKQTFNLSSLTWCVLCLQNFASCIIIIHLMPLCTYLYKCLLSSIMIFYEVNTGVQERRTKNNEKDQSPIQNINTLYLNQKRKL